MAMVESLNVTSLRNKLKTLCSVDGWSYVIFWGIHPQNTSMLSIEDVYYEDQLGEEIVNTVAHFHSMGEGVVGQAALTSKHRWVDSDGQTCEDDYLHPQFLSGIKTVVVISVKPWGVVQFGSKRKILDRVKFVEQTERLLRGIEDEGLLDVLNSRDLYLDCENCDLNGLLASISSENLYDWNLKSVYSDNSEMLLGNSCSYASLDDSFPSMDMILVEEGTTPMHGFSYLCDQLAPAIEAQAVFSDRDSTDYSMNNIISRNPSFGTWSGEISSLNSLGQQRVSEIRDEDVMDVHCKVANAFSSNNKLPVQDSKLSSLYGENRVLDPTCSFQYHIGCPLDIQHSAQSSIVAEVNYADTFSMMHDLPKDLEPADSLEQFSKFFSMNDLCHLLAPSDHDIYGTVTALDESQGFNTPSFGLIGSGGIHDVPVTCQAENISSITATPNLDGQETYLPMHCSENGLLDSMRHHLSCDQAEEWWGSVAILTPVLSAAVTDTAFSDCISESNVGTFGSGKRLFSELGIEEFFSGSNFGDESSTNRKQRTESSPENRNPKHLASHALDPKLNMTNNLVDKKEMFSKSQVGVGGLWINDGNSNTGPVQEKPQKVVQHNKVTRKRARPGETTRPRPKDRQQIQDRIGELRGIIPNGGKCSIDSLLDRTIRYMIFLQSITKYADKLQEPSEPKLIEMAKDSNVGDSKKSGGGVTCGFEVEGQTIVCPIIVEDMDPPGQMLIEMLFEEQGSFLEVVDIIGGFGLNILKGRMEIRETKIWARFIVEANKHVTRIDVFWFLIRLLQQKNASGTDSPNWHCNVNDVGSSSMHKYEQQKRQYYPCT